MIGRVGAIFVLAGVAVVVLSQALPDRDAPAAVQADGEYRVVVAGVAREVYRPATPTPSPIPPTPTATPAILRIASRAACYEHPDRYNWRKYAVIVGFPSSVLDELGRIVEVESHGDLCARNSGSGAVCWLQLHPGRPAYFDPLTCMRGGFQKWLDGGGSFYKHWYRHW